jgi:hypothetical protein
MPRAEQLNAVFGACRRAASRGHFITGDPCNPGLGGGLGHLRKNLSLFGQGCV